MPPPRLSDKQSWEQQLMEHRRALLERLVAEFRDQLAEKTMQVETWRVRLGGKKRGAL